MITTTETELFLLAEEKGWEYAPACDEVFLLLAEEETFPVDPVPVVAPKVNKRKLRQTAIKRYMVDVKEDIDWQTIANDILNDREIFPLWEGKSEDERDQYIMGIIKFCEHACFKD